MCKINIEMIEKKNVKKIGLFDNNWHVFKRNLLNILGGNFNYSYKIFNYKEF